MEKIKKIDDGYPCDTRDGPQIFPLGFKPLISFSFLRFFIFPDLFCLLFNLTTSHVSQHQTPMQHSPYVYYACIRF